MHAAVCASRFTGKERDTESGLDDFGARYYTSNQRRFLTPDWSDEPDPVPYADLEDPQSLNLYGYVGNNPLNSVDDDGHFMLACPCGCNSNMCMRKEDVSSDWDELVLFLNLGLNVTRILMTGNHQKTQPVAQTTPTAQSTPADPNKGNDKRRYEKSSKHGRTKKGNVSAAPKDGQTALDSSVQVKDTSPRRVGVDKLNNEIVVLDRTSDGVFHGHVREWQDLSSQMQNALKDAGLTDAGGNIK